MVDQEAEVLWEGSLVSEVFFSDETWLVRESVGEYVVRSVFEYLPEFSVLRSWGSWI